MTIFDKPAQTIAQHLDTLRQRGLAIPDEGRARHNLGNISYYRLSAYTRPFYQPGQADHIILVGTSFEDVLHFYVFDPISCTFSIATISAYGTKKPIETWKREHQVLDGACSGSRS